MYFQKIKLYQQRDFSSVINATFLFLRQNFKPLFRAHLHINGPIILLLLLVTTAAQMGVGFDFQARFDSESMGWYTQTPDYWLGTAIAGLAGLTFYVFIFLVTGAYMKLYHQAPPETTLSITPQEVWAAAKPKIGPKIVALILYSLAVGFGLVLCVLPGVFVAVAFWLYLAAIFFDEKGGVDALSRSYELVKGNWWVTFGLALVIGIIGAIIGLVLNLPTIVFGAFITINSLSDQTELVNYSPTFYLWAVVITSLFGYIANLFSYTLINITSVFQYGNLVEQKEARGLTHAIDETMDSPSDQNA